MTARALEVVGERWSLLIVRDLLLGPRRFSDLARSLAEITPTRLTERLRQLEAAGIVVREAPARGREVWYRLTEAGRDLEPVVDSLTLWAIDHALEGPRPGEPVRGEATLTGTKVWLGRYGAGPSGPVTWVWRFSDDDSYTLRFDGRRWSLSRGPDDEAALTVVAGAEAWAAFLTSPREGRVLPSGSIAVEGSRAEVRKLAKAFHAKLGPARRPTGSGRPRAPRGR